VSHAQSTASRLCSKIWRKKEGEKLEHTRGWRRERPPRCGFGRRKAFRRYPGGEAVRWDSEGGRGKRSGRKQKEKKGRPWARRKKESLADQDSIQEGRREVIKITTHTSSNLGEGRGNKSLSEIKLERGSEFIGAELRRYVGKGKPVPRREKREGARIGLVTREAKR